MDRLPSTHTTPRARAAGLLVNLLLCAVGLTLAQRAEAQDAPAAPPAAAPAPVASPAPAPVETTPAAPAPVVAPTPEPPPPPVEVAPIAEQPPPAEEAAAPSPMSIGAWAHLGTNIDGAEDKLDRLTADGELNLLFSADLIEGFGMTANLVGGYGGGVIAGGVSVMDLHAKIGVDDAFNIWIGRMLVPSDRANFSGVWFAAPWYYPGLHSFNPADAPVGPQQGPSGRNDGVTFWGQFAGGLFKYYAGAYDLHETSGKALFSGRLNLSLINPEPGYYHSSTYYGGKDLLAIGVSGQFEKDGSGLYEDPDPDDEDPTAVLTDADDYTGFSADVLFEKNFGDGGVLDLEGAFYAYMGDYEAYKHSYFLTASWMTANKIGVGKIQPLIRFQQAKPESGDTSTIIEPQIGYIVDNYATRLALGFAYHKQGDFKDNKIFLGIQVQK